MIDREQRRRARGAFSFAGMPLAGLPRIEDDEVSAQILGIPCHFATTLYYDMLIQTVLNAVTAGTTEQKSSVLDMQGFDSVAFFLSLGTVSAGSVMTATIKSNTANSTSSPTPVTETGATATATDSGGATSNGWFLLDLFRPLNRYVFLDFTRTTANAAINCAIAIQYNSKAMPPLTQNNALSGFVAGAFAGPND